MPDIAAISSLIVSVGVLVVSVGVFYLVTKLGSALERLVDNGSRRDDRDRDDR